MTDQQAKWKGVKAARKMAWKHVEDYEQYVLIFVDHGNVTSKPVPRGLSLRGARRYLQDYPGAKLYKWTYVPV